VFEFEEFDLEVPAEFSFLKKGSFHGVVSATSLNQCELQLNKHNTVKTLVVDAIQKMQ